MTAGASYPWADWFAQGSFVLIRGRDFHGRAYTMAQQVRNAARLGKHNIKVSITIAEDESSMRVLVFPRSRKDLPGARPDGGERGK